MKKIFLLIVVVFLTACGQKFEGGTYENAAIERSFNFHADGKVTAYSKGNKIDEGPYTVNGDQIQVFNGPVFKLLKDGSIDAGMGYGRLTKK